MIIMNLYPLTENHTKALESFEEVRQGDLYILKDHDLETAIRKDREIILMNERSNEHAVIFIANNKGEQPFAPFTNDCARDMDDNDVLSKVVVKKGYKVYIVLHSEEAVRPLYIFNVEDIDVKDISLKVTAEFVGTTLNAPQNLALNHLIKAVRQKDIKIQLKDKFCFQTTRNVMNCLMVRDANSKLRTERDGKIYELNKNSFDRRDYMGNVYPEGFYRVFYSRRMENSKLIFVEGVRIPNEYFNINIDEYLDSVDYNATKNIRKLVTHGGMEFYGIINSRGEIRVIMNVGFFTSFALSEYEISDYIKEIHQIEYSNAVNN